VKVRVLAVNKELRQIDFLLEEMVLAGTDDGPQKRLRRAQAEFDGKKGTKRPPSRLEERDGRRKTGKANQKGKSRRRR